MGSAILRQLQLKGFSNLITRSSDELDLTNQREVKKFFKQQKPSYVIIAAARVGGIHANNTYPAEFIYQNIMIEANIIHSSYENGVSRLLFLGSTCIYPKEAKQPMQEGALLTGRLEKTNEPYALAKIAGIKLCESYNRQYGTDFRSIMPTNLYGENDNFHLSNSHVIPALLRKIHLAKCIEEENWEAVKNDLAKNPIDGLDIISSQNDILVALDDCGIHCDLATMNSTVNIWGTGNVKREFLYVDDMALAAIFILELNEKAYQQNTQPMLSHINIGTGIDIKINVLAQKIKEVVGFKGNLFFDSSKLDGPLRKLTDVSKISNMGWKADINLEKGLRKTYDWYLN